MWTNPPDEEFRPWTRQTVGRVGSLGRYDFKARMPYDCRLRAASSARSARLPSRRIHSSRRARGQDSFVDRHDHRAGLERDRDFRPQGVG